MASDLSNSIENESITSNINLGDGVPSIRHHQPQHQLDEPREAMEIAIDETSSFIISDDDVDKETAGSVGSGIHQDPGFGRKILNDVHLIRSRYASTNQRIKRDIELMSEDKVSRLRLEEVHTSLPSSIKSTFIMTFSPDGCRVASTHGDHRIYICDLNTGKLLDTLEGHPKTPWCLAWHPTNREILASGCLAGEVRVWDLKTKACESWTNGIANNNHHNNIITSLDFHPKERILVIATNNSVNFWDWAKSEPFARVDTAHQRENVKFVVFDSTGTKLITGINNLPKFASGTSVSLQPRIIDSYSTQGNFDQSSSPPTTTEHMTQQSSETATPTSHLYGQAIFNDTDINLRNTTNIPQQQQQTNSVGNHVESLRTSVNASAGVSSNRSQLIDEQMKPSTSQATGSVASTSSPCKRKGQDEGLDPESKKKKTDQEFVEGESSSRQAPSVTTRAYAGVSGLVESQMAATPPQSQHPLGPHPNSAMAFNDPMTGQPMGLSHHTILLNQFGGSNSNVTLATQDPVSPERFVVWNNGTQSVEQSLQRIIAAAAANLQHTILVKIYHRSHGPGGSSSANLQPGGSPTEANPTAGHLNDRPPFESRRRALSQDLSAAGVTPSSGVGASGASGGGGSTSPPAGLPAWLAASLSAHNASPSNQEPPNSRYNGSVRQPPIHGLFPLPPTSNNNNNNNNNGLAGFNNHGNPAAGVNNNGNINYETWQRHPHVHVYQSRGSGQHLWFNHWTIPLPANQSNYRLQCWNFSSTAIPNIKDATSNIVTQRCRIHNASSIDISSDGRLLACLVPRDETNVSSFDLRVFSLQAQNLGACLYQTNYGPNAISVSLSPSANYVVVGLKSPRFISNNPTDDDLTIAKVFKLSDDIYTNNGRDDVEDNDDCSSKHSQNDNVDNNGNIRYIREIKIKRRGSALNLNAIKWMPRGIVYNVGPQHHQRHQATRLARERRVGF